MDTTACPFVVRQAKLLLGKHEATLSLCCEYREPRTRELNAVDVPLTIDQARHIAMQGGIPLDDCAVAAFSKAVGVVWLDENGHATKIGDPFGTFVEDITAQNGQP